MEKSKELFLRDAKSVSNVMKLRFYPFVAKSGEGAVLKDPDGREYLDFSAGWGVMNTGYNHPRIIKAVCDQMNKLSFASTTSVISQNSVELAELLAGLTPGDFEKSVWYGHSGSDANEFISKAAPAATGRSKMLTFIGSCHGQSIGACAMSGLPALSGHGGGGNVIKTPYPYCYRCAFERDARSCGLFCLRYIEDYVFRAVVDPDQVAAVIIESVQCDGGEIVPPDGFLQGLERLCRKYDILFIVDEVKIGFGRTGKMFGFENWGVVPDAVVMAKPMASGQPLSAVVGRKELMNPGAEIHLFTTAGNPVACAAARETIQIINDEGLADNAERTGKYFVERLEALKEKHPIIGDIRGRGLVIGAEIVEDRETKKPAAEKTALIVYRAYELGLLFYSVGIYSNVLEFTPPLIVTMKQIDKAVGIIGQAIEDVENDRVPIDKVAEFAGWSS